MPSSTKGTNPGGSGETIPPAVAKPPRCERAIPLGEYGVAANGETLTATVGMAVFIGVRDPLTGFGGAASILLPEDDMASDAASAPAKRLGNLEMEHLLTALHKRGVPRARLEFFVTGAAADDAGHSLARANESLARYFLTIEQLHVVREDLGGTLARDIAFTPASGEWQIRSCRNERTRELLSSERRYLDLHRARAGRDDITLFC
jgi:chemotaxis receptor (MCP) glutamine deamidase CheD